MSTLARMTAIAHGRVQGVFFRDFTRTQAIALGLTGYVRNLPDGTVETVAEGAREALESFLAQLRMGPPSARVDRVEVQWGDHRGEFARFEVRFR
jgi:acylphosphatase